MFYSWKALLLVCLLLAYQVVSAFLRTSLPVACLVIVAILVISVSVLRRRRRTNTNRGAERVFLEENPHYGDHYDGVEDRELEGFVIDQNDIYYERK